MYLSEIQWRPWGARQLSAEAFRELAMTVRRRWYRKGG